MKLLLKDYRKRDRAGSSNMSSLNSHFNLVNLYGVEELLNIFPLMSLSTLRLLYHQSLLTLIEQESMISIRSSRRNMLKVQRTLLIHLKQNKGLLKLRIYLFLEERFISSKRLDRLPKLRGMNLHPIDNRSYSLHLSTKRPQINKWLLITLM